MTLKTAIKMLEEEYERAKKIEYVENPLAWALRVTQCPHSAVCLKNMTV